MCYIPGRYGSMKPLARLYAVVGAHLGDNETWTGAVYRSTDGCNSWSAGGRQEQTASATTGPMTWWVCTTSSTSTGTMSIPHRAGWRRAATAARPGSGSPVPDTACRVRLAVFQDRLLALTLDQRGLTTVDGAGHVQIYPLPNFRIPDYAFNYLATDRAGYLYAITDDGRVVRSRDLVAWETLAVTDRALVTIAYWPARNWIVVADRGADARLWKIDLNARALPASPFEGRILTRRLYPLYSR